MTKQIANVRFIYLNFFGVFVFGLLLNAMNSQAIANNECGTIKIPTEGNQTHKGFWPFAVAIYEIKEHKHLCGGTLISRKHVLTGT